MPTWLIIVLGVLVLLVLVLAISGAAWNRRHRERTRADLLARITSADRALAAAVAADRGWDRSVLDAAARSALADRDPALAGATLTLILVDDQPGTEDDRAVFEVDGGESAPLTLIRRGGTWHADAGA